MLRRLSEHCSLNISWLSSKDLDSLTKQPFLRKYTPRNQSGHMLTTSLLSELRQYGVLVELKGTLLSVPSSILDRQIYLSFVLLWRNHMKLFACILNIVFLLLFSYSTSSAQPLQPELSLVKTGTSITIMWTTVDGADGYNLYYAPYPYSGPAI